MEEKPASEQLIKKNFRLQVRCAIPVRNLPVLYEAPVGHHQIVPGAHV